MLPTMSLDSFHTAHLDPASGYGLVVCPRPEDDVLLDGHSVFTAAWDTACESLASLGWTPVRDDAGFLTYLGATVEGGLVVEARSFRSARTVPDAETVRALFAQVRLVTQVVRPRRG
ncbi:hypothetical protein NOMA109596_19300 [Nocardioides marinus]|uniref:Uncharacterized protein n=1 Tax=Nocardioides marinus TaxID=374514 RepID=A0A7Y9YEY7_9ACTN|nr:hypothetical protein [Nocardioides marinus]NYI10963.1 hypothetical protein [Nocardioides marinus]